MVVVVVVKVAVVTVTTAATAVAGMTTGAAEEVQGDTNRCI